MTQPNALNTVIATVVVSACLLTAPQALAGNEGNGLPQQVAKLSAEIDVLADEIDELSNAVAALGGSSPSPGQFVSLSMSPFADDCTNVGKKFDTLLNADGTSEPFEIPAGMVLVINDVEILGFGITPGEQVQTRIFTGVGLNVNSVARLETEADADGRTFDIFSFTPGVVVASGGEVCVNNSENATNSGNLRGYLAVE